MQGLYGRDSQTDRWLLSWTAEVRSANWKSADQLLKQFPLARMAERDSFVFPINGSNRGLKLRVTFPLGLAVVFDLEIASDTN